LRLEWQKDLVSADNLDQILWSHFAACDIDTFHVRFRSLFDYLAGVIDLVSDKSGQIPKSFEALQNWIDKSPNNVQRMGRDLAELISSCEWFSAMREIRNLIVHRGGHTLIFPMKNRILFQVHERWNRTILVPEIMFNENVADFELYAGLLMGYLIAYLEDVSIVVHKRLGLQRRTDSDGRLYHSGLQVIHRWIEKVGKVEVRAGLPDKGGTCSGQP
jgi:hypothetical protein